MIVIFAVGSVVCASAKSMEILLVGRCVQGAAAGGVICLVNVCISDLFCLRYGRRFNLYKCPDEILEFTDWCITETVVFTLV